MIISYFLLFTYNALWVKKESLPNYPTGTSCNITKIIFLLTLFMKLCHVQRKSRWIPSIHLCILIIFDSTSFFYLHIWCLINLTAFTNIPLKYTHAVLFSPFPLNKRMHGSNLLTNGVSFWDDKNNRNKMCFWNTNAFDNGQFQRWSRSQGQISWYQ